MSYFLFVFKFCNKVWIGSNSSYEHYKPNVHDQEWIKDRMVDKYDKKRYYTPPSEDMHVEARRLNTPAKAVPTTRALRPLGQVPKLAQNSIVISQVCHSFLS